MIDFKNFARFQAFCHSQCWFTSTLGSDNLNGNRRSLLSIWGFPGGSDGKESACNAEDVGLIPGWEDPLEKGMAIHARILDWRTPWIKEPGGLHGVTKTWT